MVSALSHSGWTVDGSKCVDWCNEVLVYDWIISNFYRVGIEHSYGIRTQCSCIQRYHPFNRGDSRSTQATVRYRSPAGATTALHIRNIRDSASLEQTVRLQHEFVGFQHRIRRRMWHHKLAELFREDDGVVWLARVRGNHWQRTAEWCWYLLPPRPLRTQRWSDFVRRVCRLLWVGRVPVDWENVNYVTFLVNKSFLNARFKQCKLD